MNFYQQWNEACLQADIPAISTDTAARLMAVLHEYGNNEGFTYNQRFQGLTLPKAIGTLRHDPTGQSFVVYKPISRFKRLMLRWAFGLKFEKI